MKNKDLQEFLKQHPKYENLLSFGTMNYFISLLLQFPLYYVLINGLAALTGLVAWWFVPIAIGIVFMHDFGGNIRRGE